MQEEYRQDRRKVLLEVLEETGRSVHQLLVRLTLREDVAAEVMQEVYLGLAGDARAEGSGNRGGYVLRSAIGAAFAWRKKQRHGAVSIDKVGEVSGQADRPLAEVVRREELEAVLDATGRLGRHIRDAIVMKYIDSRSHEYIAEQLGKRRQYVVDMCHRGRGRLVRVLEGMKRPGAAGQTEEEYSERKLLRRLGVLSEVEPIAESTEHAMGLCRKAIMEAKIKDVKPRAPVPWRTVAVGAAVLGIVICAGVICVAVVKNREDAKKENVVTTPKPVEKEVTTKPVTPEKTVKKAETPPVEGIDVSAIDGQIKEVRALAAAGDIDGLVRLLDEGDFAVKLIAAMSLMEIGDERAIEPMERLSAQWYGDKERNPFTEVIAAIRERIGAEAAVVEPANIEDTRTDVITGFVNDDSGKAVEGATVVATVFPADRERYKYSQKRVTTGARGEFVVDGVPEGQIFLKAFCNGYVASLMRDFAKKDGQRQEGVEIVMGAPGAVEGVVYDSAGKGKAKVELSFEDGPGAGAKQVAKVSTDADGHFRAKCVPGQMCYVRRADAESGLGAVRRAVLPSETEVVQMDMGCVGRTVRGSIAADGVAYTNGRVVLSDAYGAEMSVFGSVGKTDGEGRFAIEAPVDGRYGVYYESPTGKGQWVRAAVVDMAGRGGADVGMVSQAAGAIHVSVAEEDPNDMDAGMKVVLQEGHGFWGKQVGEGKRAPDSDVYVIEGVRPGEYTVAVNARGGLVYRQEMEYDAATMGDIEMAVDVTRDRGVAGGRYVNGTGQMLVLTDQMQRAAYYFGKDGRGQFNVSGLAKGQYSICADFHGAALVLAEFGVGEGTDETVSVDTSQWTEAGRNAVCVQVVGGGSMIVGADVQMTDGYEMAGPAAVTAEGSWFIVDAGSHRVSAEWPGYSEATMEIEVAAGDVWGKAGKANTVIVDLGDREGN